MGDSLAIAVDYIRKKLDEVQTLDYLREALTSLGDQDQIISLHKPLHDVQVDISNRKYYLIQTNWVVGKLSILVRSNYSDIIKAEGHLKAEDTTEIKLQELGDEMNEIVVLIDPFGWNK